MSTPIPNITGGAATAGDTTTGVEAAFGPINIGGLFGSGAQGSSIDKNTLLIGGLVIAALFLFRKKL